MRAVLTRVTEASVSISGSTVAEIGQGYLVLLGVHTEDKPEQAAKMADRIAGLRIFEDEAWKMNRNLAAVGGAVLLVSQFTLYADTRSRRPGFTAAARPDVAVPLYEQVIADLRGRGFHVETGVFGADMAVQSVYGPVTILLET